MTKSWWIFWMMRRSTIIWTWTVKDGGHRHSCFFYRILWLKVEKYKRLSVLDPLKDANGKSALVVALENERLDCLEILLDYGVKVGDALLYAIKKQQVSAVKLLFSRMRPEQCQSGSLSTLWWSKNVVYIRTVLTFTVKIIQYKLILQNDP